MSPGAPWEVLGSMLVCIGVVWFVAMLWFVAWAWQERNRQWREFKRRQDELERNRERIRKAVSRGFRKP